MTVMVNIPLGVSKVKARGEIWTSSAHLLNINKYSEEVND